MWIYYCYSLSFAAIHINLQIRDKLLFRSWVIASPCLRLLGNCGLFPKWCNECIQLMYIVRYVFPHLGCLVAFCVKYSSFMISFETLLRTGLSAGNVTHLIMRLPRYLLAIFKRRCETSKVCQAENWLAITETYEWTTSCIFDWSLRSSSGQ